MNPEHFSSDFLEFVEVLNRYNVKYLIVGGEAVIYYGYPRFTGDIDFYFQAQEQNVDRLWAALNDFWGGDVPAIDAKEELLQKGMIFQFGLPPNRIDLINRIDGETFENAWASRNTEEVKLGGNVQKLEYIGLESLIKNKRSVRRPKDQEDLKYLEQLQKKKK